jgi:hypothetical protein
VTPAELFHRAGVALFGDQYVAPMAVALGVEKNTVGKWRDGKSRIPPGAWGDLRKIMVARAHEMIATTTAVCELEEEVREAPNEKMAATP